jgi:hypothetical protein
VGQDRVLGRLHAEELRQLSNRSPVRDPGRDVRPLPRIGTLAEQAAELVERGVRTEDSVRVVVDERDAV